MQSALRALFGLGECGRGLKLIKGMYYLLWTVDPTVRNLKWISDGKVLQLHLSVGLASLTIYEGTHYT